MKTSKRPAPDVVELADEPVTQELEEDAVFSRYYEEERPLEISIDISRYKVVNDISRYSNSISGECAFSLLKVLTGILKLKKLAINRCFNMVSPHL